MMSIFRDDPFFSFPSDPLDDFFADFRTSSLMNALTFDPMGGRGMGREGRDSGSRSRRSRDRRDLMMFDPFESMNAMMSSMQSMGNLHREMERGISDGNGTMFSSSSYLSYNAADGGEPKIYEARSSCMQGPGGVRETRRSERNSVTGYDKMAVGRHINDRGHVITKQRDRRTGQIEENQDYLNIDEQCAQDFDNEWSEKARYYLGSRGHRSDEVTYDDSLRSNRGGNIHAIEDGRSGSNNNAYRSSRRDDAGEVEQAKREKSKNQSKNKKRY